MPGSTTTTTSPSRIKRDGRADAGVVAVVASVSRPSTRRDWPRRGRIAGALGCSDPGDGGQMDEGMHRYTEETEEAARAIVDYATRSDTDGSTAHRRADDGGRAGRPIVGETVTPKGIGSDEALRLFADVLAPACISVDNPRFLAFVPAAPTKAAILFDLVVSASSIFAGTWLEAAGLDVRREPGARVARLAGRDAGRGRRRVRLRRHRREPLRAWSRRAMRSPSGAEDVRTAGACWLPRRRTRRSRRRPASWTRTC